MLQCSFKPFGEHLIKLVSEDEIQNHIKVHFENVDALLTEKSLDEDKYKSLRNDNFIARISKSKNFDSQTTTIVINPYQWMSVFDIRPSDKKKITLSRI